MRPIRRVVPQALAWALCVLLTTLAVLQYRWIGQVNDAAYDRLLRAAGNSAAQFRVEFDRELARAFLSLQISESTMLGAETAAGRYADRYATWRRTSQHPALVQDVYLVTLDGGDGPDDRPVPRALRWDVAAAAFADVDWNSTPLRRARDRVARALRAAAYRPGEALDLDGAVITGPLRLLENRAGEEAPVPGMTVLALDVQYVREAWLPELAARHFSDDGADAYRVAIVDNGPGREVLYRTDAAAPLIDGQADVVERLSITDEADPYLVEDGAGSRLPAGVSALDWTLLAAHRSGSVAAAVAPARLRNLATSFGVLVLLGGSVGMLVWVSRLEQRQARQRLELVAGVSHELRTPVSVIQAAAANLQGGVVEGDRVRTYGATIAEQARRLAEMVEGALDFARVESHQAAAPQVRVSPAALVDRAIDSLPPALADGARIERLGLPGLPDVAGDEDALATAVQNLIANALKYGGADRWVGVRGETGGSSHRPEVRLSVEDRGPGITRADHARVFEPFQRGAAAADRRIAGSGLGLALVRRIAEAHGGRVTVASTPGSGTVFTLHLPAAEAAHPASRS